MQIHSPVSHRAAPQGRHLLASLIALAAAFTFAVPASAQSPDNEAEGQARLLNVVPSEAVTGAADAISDLVDKASAESDAGTASDDAAAAADAAPASGGPPSASIVAPSEVIEGGATTDDASSAATPASAEGAASVDASEGAAADEAAAPAAASGGGIAPASAEGGAAPAVAPGGEAAPASPSGAAAVASEEGAVPAAAPQSATAPAAAAENDPLLLALTDVKSPVDLYQNLVAAGYEVAVVAVDSAYRHTLLVKTSAGPAGILLLVDGHTGQILSHEATGPDGYTYPNGQPAQVYSPSHGAPYQPPAGYGSHPPASYGTPGQGSGY